MKKHLFTPLLVLMPFFAWTQDLPITQMLSVPATAFITANILTPAVVSTGYTSPVNTPRWRFGAILPLGVKTAVGLDIGYGHTKLSISATGEKYRLFEMRPEFYYKKPQRKRYMSIELFYIHHTEQFENQWYSVDRIPVYLYYFSQADYQRTKLGIIPKIGWIFPLSAKLDLNFYMGLGYRYRKNKYSNVRISTGRNYVSNLFADPFYEKEGTVGGLEPNAGFRLFFKLY